jgi:putative restriction endonuclease
MDTASQHAQLRQAAFSHVNWLSILRGGVLDSGDLAGGFQFGGERIPLINPQRGIFKPRQMEHLLSIKTVFPRKGARVWYDDQREVHRQIYAGDDVVDYQFMGTDPNSADNRWLRDAMQRQIPVRYFLGGTVRLTCGEQKRARRRMCDHAAATASRHWFAASARRIRSVERETRWR